MRILNVIASTDATHGGPIEWVRQFGSVALKKGHDVEVLSMDDPKAPWLGDFALPIHAVGSSLHGFYSGRLAPWLRTHAPRYDCVIAHGLWRYPSFGTWRVLRNSQTPYFVYTHGMLGPWFKHTYPLKHFGKTLYWPLTEYRVLKDANAVLFTCEQEKLLARQSFKQYECNEVVATLGITVPSTEDLAGSDRFLSEFSQCQGKRLLLFLGRIHKVKGCDILVRAFGKIAKHHPHAHLVMAGPDPSGLIPGLQATAASLGVSDRITWTGMLHGELKWGALRAAEAVVLPSHHENFSFTTVEALACGTPTLLSDQVGIWREVLNDGGALVGPDSEAGVTMLLETWLSLEPSARNQMSKAARQCFRERFEAGKATDHLLNTLMCRASAHA